MVVNIIGLQASSLTSTKALIQMYGLWPINILVLCPYNLISLTINKKSSLKKTGTFFLTRDNLKLGLVLGLITPLIVLVIIYFLKFSDIDFGQFIKEFKQTRQYITFWGVWCLVGNIALFTYYINTNKDRTAKGIFAITLVYGIGILLLKLFI